MITPPRFQQRPWPKLRDALVTFLEAHRPHTFWGLSEVDVTDVLAAIERLRREHRVAVSFHAYVLYCLAQAARAHPGVLSYRKGRRILTFDDIDIGTTVERRLADGVRIPVGYVLRAAERKSLAEINRELREVARRDLAQDETVRMRRRLLAMPGFVRRLLRWKIVRDPLWLRRFYGTIGCTNLAIPGTARTGFALPPNVYTLSVAVGWTSERPAVRQDGTIAPRQILCLACGIDHAVVDGIPVSLWAKTFLDSLQSAAGLDESLAAETRRLLRRAKE